MAELTSKLIEMHQRIVIGLQTRVNILTERNWQVEHVCKALRDVLYTAPIELEDAHQAWYEQYDIVMAQYKQLFGEEKPV
jgi:hypothetical protein